MFTPIRSRTGRSAWSKAPRMCSAATRSRPSTTRRRDEASIGIASHQVDVFILEPVTDRYLGRLCDFNACPKGKAECRVPGCGDVTLLRQHEGFRWRPESLAEGRAVQLFERATGLQRCASDVPLLEVDAG